MKYTKKSEIRLTEEQWELAQQHAKALGLTFSAYIREAIKEKAAKQPHKDFEKRVIKVINNYHNKETQG